MEKSIIIGGVSRSGKSTLASMIKKAKSQYSFIPGDAFIGAFETVFPETGISHAGDSHEVICKKFEPFIFTFLEKLSDDEKVPFILDSFHVMPEQIARRGLKEKYKTVFIGYPNLTVDQKLEMIYEHDDKDSWTRTVDQAVFREWVGEFVTNSKIIQQQCEQYGIDFIDTGALGHKAGLQKALEILL
jgi:2-phosphoglycerate kinase